jgi:tetratricopeptide (TPR) repeat protein
MLFDLRSAGRRRTIKVVYVTLAFLMGGGLVFFGIGGDVSGGLVDAITERGGGGDTGSEAAQKREERALRATRANPRDAAAWTELARARYQLASADADPNTGQFGAEGRAKLRQAGQAWDRYLALEPEKPDDKVARTMVQVYAALNDLPKAARAQEIVAEAADTSNAYAQLAVLSYQAGQERKGDLARRQAIEKAEPDMRESIKGQIDQAKTQAQAEQAQPQQGEQP